MLPVSVVIPAYNASRYIRQAVDSVLAQPEGVAEIIVVDDGSSDNIRSGLGSREANVILIRQANAGPAAARNRGIEAATRPWLAFLDADDYWTPGKLAAQFAVVDACPSVAMVASDMAEVDVDGRVVVPSVLAAHGMLAHFAALRALPVPKALSLLLTTNFVPTGTVLARRDAVVAAGGFPVDIRYGEDLALWARLATAHDIVCLPTVHMYRRKHDTNVTRAGSPLYRDVARVVDDITTWGAARLRAEGHSPAVFKADAWCDYGYSLFSEGRYVEARGAFRRSLAAVVNRRALRYLALSILPESVLTRLRAARET
jgi:glycosyltransferase involved in cell wall biosynthesis